MERVNADPAGIRRMLPKARHYLIGLEGVPAPLAHILKEAFLAHGCDAVVDRDLITGRVAHTRVVLCGTRNQFQRVIVGLVEQGSRCETLAKEIEAAIRHFDSPALVPEPEHAADPRLARLFEGIGNRTLVMGILNVTPDSFSDGGLFADKDSAVQHAVRMVEEGADVIDVGGQSTRPGSQPIPVEQEIDRVVPVIRELASRLDVPISVDTYVAEVAKAALDSGALMINDISAASFDPDMPDLIAERQCPAILMHIKGTPMDMQLNPRYDDLMGEICAFLRERVRAVVEAGADEKRLMIDPGFGFGKTVEHNLEILRRLGELRSLGRPVVVGTSRKSTIGKVLGDLPVGERLEGTAATVTLCIARGADIVRVHDVKQMARVARMTDAVTRLPQPCQPSAPR